MTPDTQAAPLSAPKLTDEHAREIEAADMKRLLADRDMEATMQLYKGWQRRALQAEARAEAAESALKEAQDALAETKAGYAAVNEEYAICRKLLLERSADAVGHKTAWQAAEEEVKRLKRKEILLDEILKRVPLEVLI